MKSEDLGLIRAHYRRLCPKTSWQANKGYVTHLRQPAMPGTLIERASKDVCARLRISPTHRRRLGKTGRRDEETLTSAGNPANLFKQINEPPHGWRLFFFPPWLGEEQNDWVRVKYSFGSPRRETLLMPPSSSSPGCQPAAAAACICLNHEPPGGEEAHTYFGKAIASAEIRGGPIITVISRPGQANAFSLSLCIGVSPPVQSQRCSRPLRR